MPPKDFKSGLKNMTGPEVVLSDDKAKPATGKPVARPFGESFREQLDREYEQKPVKEIPLSMLQDNPFQHLARTNLDPEKLEELATSIRENGFYGALLARRKRGVLEEYELAYGHRRREAARKAGLTSVPVKIVDLNDTQMARVMASENFSRENLAPMGEANVVGFLRDNFNMSSMDLARSVGKGEGWVNLRLGLYEAPEDVKRMVEQKPDTISFVPFLKQVKEPSQRAELVREVLINNLTREALKERIASFKNPSRRKSDSEKIDTNITNSIPHQDSEISNNVYTEVADEIKEESTSYQETVRTRNANGTARQEQYAGLLMQIAGAMDELERLKSSGKVKPNKQQEAFLVSLMERITGLLSK
jgi:ParB/RepB/Spo0J family partition protein